MLGSISAITQTMCFELLMISVTLLAPLCCFSLPSGTEYLQGNFLLSLFLLFQRGVVKYFKSCFELPGHENTLSNCCMFLISPYTCQELEINALWCHKHGKKRSGNMLPCSDDKSSSNIWTWEPELSPGSTVAFILLLKSAGILGQHWLLNNQMSKLVYNMLRASISQIASVYLYTALIFLPSLAHLSADILHLDFTFLKVFC